MLDFLSDLAELHLNASLSDPAKIADIPDDERSEGEARTGWFQEDLQHRPIWPGIYKTVGIFTEGEWNLIMCKCLASMGTLQSCASLRSF